MYYLKMFIDINKSCWGDRICDMYIYFVGDIVSRFKIVLSMDLIEK